MQLAKVDISTLSATGWKPPMSIKMTARDGKTDIYGLLFRPTNFDASKKYPIVNHVSPGPQTGSTGSRAFGYLVAAAAEGRGVGRALCEDSLRRAKAKGFRGMQFNFVMSTNERAVHLWQSCGFETVGRLPAAFAHPTLGYVDALVMYRAL